MFSDISLHLKSGSLVFIEVSCSPCVVIPELGSLLYYLAVQLFTYVSYSTETRLAHICLKIRTYVSVFVFQSKNTAQYIFVIFLVVHNVTLNVRKKNVLI